MITGKGAALGNVNQIRNAEVQKGQALWPVLMQCSQHENRERNVTHTYSTSQGGHSSLCFTNLSELDCAVHSMLMKVFKCEWPYF